MSTEKSRKEIDQAQRRDQQRREVAMDKRDAEHAKDKPDLRQEPKEERK